MEAMLFVHPKNDFTGSTRVLATVIASEYKDVHVSVITNNESRCGFLSELDNVSIIPYRRLNINGRSIPKLTEVWNWIQIFMLVLLHGRRHGKLYINTIVPFSMECESVPDVFIKTHQSFLFYFLHLLYTPRYAKEVALCRV